MGSFCKGMVAWDSLCFQKSLSWASFFKKSSSWDPLWNAGVLIVSRSVLAVKSSVQGYFYSCLCTLKGEYTIFSSSKTVSSQIIGRLSPVVWGTHGSEVPLTIFFSSFFNLYMYHFFLQSLPLFLYQPILQEVSMTMARLCSGSWVHGKVPLSLVWPENGLVDKDWGDYYFSAKSALELESLKPQE
jgi:hypothetical protein